MVLKKSAVLLLPSWALSSCSRGNLYISIDPTWCKRSVSVWWREDKRKVRGPEGSCDSQRRKCWWTRRRWGRMFEAANFLVCFVSIPPPPVDPPLPVDYNLLRLMESRGATCGPSKPPPSPLHICLWFRLMCRSSSLNLIHFHFPLLFTLHLLSDTHDVWF